jgi:hypothetical protein
MSSPQGETLDHASFAAIAVLKVEILGFFLPDLFSSGVRSWSTHSKFGRGLSRASILANEQKIG